jgi:predicted RNase H-like HicB family nuclease
MKLTVIVHEAILQGRGFANEGGYWAEVPAIPGCATEGDSWDELISNLHETIEVDGVKQSNQRLEQKIDDVSTEMNGKLDLIIRRLTGMN